jgi:huckebein
MCPPQTYSRLFRPWDIVQTTTTRSLNSPHEKIKSEIYDNITSEKNIAINIMEPTNSGSSKGEIRTTFHTFGTNSSGIKDYQQQLPQNYSVTYNISEHVPTQFDPYMLSLMEQEYLRVLNEEAQSKAMSAKRQRPKKFKCPHCDVAFTNNGQLKGHIRIHTGKCNKRLFSRLDFYNYKPSYVFDLVLAHRDIYFSLYRHHSLSNLKSRCNMTNRQLFGLV